MQKKGWPASFSSEILCWKNTLRRAEVKRELVKSSKEKV